MSRIRLSAPVDPTDRFADTIKSLQEQVAELQRAASNVTPWRRVGASGQPAFTNSWVNFDPSATTFERAAFRKIGDIVYIRGLVASGSLANAVFVLPTDCRPPKTLVFQSICSSVATVARLDIDAVGNVLAQSGANGFFSINCQFSTSASP